MELTIRADDFHELKKKVVKLAQEFETVKVQLELPLTETKIEKKKHTKKPTEVVVEDSEAQITMSEEDLEVVEASPSLVEKIKEKSGATKIDVQNALQAVFDRHGLAECHKALKPFGAKALRDIKKEDYDAVLVALKKAAK